MNDFFEITFSFQDPKLDGEEIEDITINLFKQLSEMDGILIDRVNDLNPPTDNMSGGGFLEGVLKVKVYAEKLKEFMVFLGDKLSGETIDMNVKFKGAKLNIKAKNKEDLLAAIQSIKELIELSNNS